MGGKEREGEAPSLPPSSGSQSLSTLLSRQRLRLGLEMFYIKSERILQFPLSGAMIHRILPQLDIGKGFDMLSVP